MTRKDYEAFAKVFANLGPRDPRTEDAYIAGYDDGTAQAARRLADVLAADNPRFDRARFLKACGVAQ